MERCAANNPFTFPHNIEKLNMEEFDMNYNKKSIEDIE